MKFQEKHCKLQNLIKFAPRKRSLKRFLSRKAEGMAL